MFLLRLADLQRPAMDKLFFYVRKMDDVVSSLKQSLNDLEDRLKNHSGADYLSKMINYFVYSQDEESLAGIFAQEEMEIESDDDVSVESETLEDDMTSDSETDDDEIEMPVTDLRCGTVLERAWNKRSKALRTDIAIAGWMCSPHPDVMEDCIKHTTGEHKKAVTRLFTQWFGHVVSYFYYVLLI